MKKNKILTKLIIIGFILTSCTSESNELDIVKDIAIQKSKKQDLVIQEFISSETFARFEINIKEFGNISYKEIETGIITVVNDQISVLNVPIYKDGKKVGIVEVVDLKSTKHLPNGDSYALNFVDLSNFNSETLTGTVEMFDLNYDNFKHSQISIKNNHIKSWKSNEIPMAIQLKYRKACKTKRFKLTTVEIFDLDGNGDVSFSECYHKLKELVDMDGTSQWICDIPVAGWAGCWAANSAACIYIAAFY